MAKESKSKEEKVLSSSTDKKMSLITLLSFAIILILVYIFAASDIFNINNNLHVAKVRRLIPASVTYDLTPGWNAVALPLGSDILASDVCESIDGSTRVARLSENEWEYYDCSDTEGVNFQIMSHHGYMVRVDADTEITFRGNLARTGYNVVAGLNFAGIPSAARETVYANELCMLDVEENLEVLTINSWENGAWNVHSCESSASNNYELLAGSAYLINISLVNSPALSVPSLQ